MYITVFFFPIWQPNLLLELAQLNAASAPAPAPARVPEKRRSGILFSLKVCIYLDSSFFLLTEQRFLVYSLQLIQRSLK